MLKRILYILFFCSVLIVNIYGNSGVVKGKVIDKDSNLPVEGADVVLVGTNLGSATDENGSYTIKNISPGNYTISVSFVGYETIKEEIEVKENRTLLLDYSLVKAEYELDRVTVVGKEELVEIKTSPMSVTVIDASEVESRATSLDEILNKTAGVNLRRAGGAGSESRISIRGLEGKQVKIYLDGNPLNAPDGTFGINDIPIQLVERIEVYKGIVPAKFGGDGLGGAVNVVFKEYETDYFDIGLSRESFNTNKFSLVYVNNIPEAGIKIGGGGYFNYAENNYTMDSPYQPGLSINRDHDDFTSFAGAVSGTFEKFWFDEIVIELPFLFGNKKLQGIQQNIQHAETKYTAFVGVLALKKDNFFLDDLELDYNIVLPFAKTQLIDTSRYRYTFQGDRFLSPSGIGEIGFSGNNSDNSLFEGSQKFNLNYQFTASQALNLNIDTRYSKFSPEDPIQNDHLGYDISEQKSMIFSNIFGLSYELSLFDGKLMNVFGLKYFNFYSEGYESNLYGIGSGAPPEKSTNNLSKFGFNNGFRYKLTPEVLAKVSYEHALRLPVPDELYGDGIFLQPNPLLQPEKSDNINVGLMYDYTTSDYKRYQFEINGFYMQLKDMIQLSGNGITNGYVNLGEVRITGFDTELKADITPNLYSYINFTYQNSRDIMETLPNTDVPNPTKDLRVPNIPWLFGNFGIEYTFRDLFGKNQKTKFYFASSYVEEYFYGWEVSRNQNLRIPTTFEHAIGFELSFNSNTLFVSGEVKNLTDENTFNIFNNPLPGRSFGLKIRYTWFGQN